MHNKIETELETNIRYIESRFEGCADAVMRRILVGDEKLGMYVVYMDSMYDRDFIDGVVLKSLLFDRIQLPDQNAGQVIFNKYLATADVKETNRMEMLIDEVLKGNTAILIDGMAKAMIVSSKNLPGRGVSEAETEVSVRGSKESFTESFRVNTVLIRRRIRAMTRTQMTQNTSSLSFGNLSLNQTSFELSSPSGSYQLTNKEFQLLELLMANPGQVISSDRLFEKIWGYESDADPSVIWVYISYLRKKLTALNASVRIRAIRNAGYRLEEIQ